MFVGWKIAEPIEGVDQFERNKAILYEQAKHKLDILDIPWNFHPSSHFYSMLQLLYHETYHHQYLLNFGFHWARRSDNRTFATIFTSHHNITQNCP